MKKRIVFINSTFSSNDSSNLCIKEPLLLDNNYQVGSTSNIYCILDFRPLQTNFSSMSFHFIKKQALKDTNHKQIIQLNDI